MAANQKRGHLSHTGPRSDGATRVMESVRALNRSYEGSLTAITSPVLIEFNSDQGWNSIQGWINNDGAGDISVAFSRDGTTFGDNWTMKQGELSNLKGLDIHTLRITRITADANYRVVLI